jgi:hypothetical protein
LALLVFTDSILDIYGIDANPTASPWLGGSGWG